MDEKYNVVWEKLQKKGFKKGSMIPYFIVVETCRKERIQFNSEDLNTFQKLYEVKIG